MLPVVELHKFLRRTFSADHGPRTTDHHRRRRAHICNSDYPIDINKIGFAGKNEKHRNLKGFLIEG